MQLYPCVMHKPKSHILPVTMRVPLPSCLAEGENIASLEGFPLCKEEFETHWEKECCYSVCSSRDFSEADKSKTP